MGYNTTTFKTFKDKFIAWLTLDIPLVAGDDGKFKKVCYLNVQEALCEKCFLNYLREERLKLWWDQLKKTKESMLGEIMGNAATDVFVHV